MLGGISLEGLLEFAHQLALLGIERHGRLHDDAAEQITATATAAAAVSTSDCMPNLKAENGAGRR